MRRAGTGMALLLALTGCRTGAVSTGAPPAESTSVTTRPVVSATAGPVTPASTCGDETTVIVPGGANIFGAGIDELPAPGGGGGGVAPICVAVPGGASTVTIPGASGSLSFTALRAPDVHFHKCPGGSEAILAYGPDGNPGGCPDDVPGGTIPAAGVVSGIASRGRGGYLIGVFLPEPWGGTPPPMLDFEERYDFIRLAPTLGQLFFVGDGRTAEGRLQTFRIPTGATRLYLGIADAFDFRGPPGFYDDNYGRLRIETRFE